MKKALTIILAVATMAVLFSTCKQATTSVDDCISNFMDDINSQDRSGVYESLDPNAAQYNQAKTAIYWGVFFPVGEIPYTMSNISKSGSTVTASVTSSTGVTYPAGSTLTFAMGEDSDKNAVISSITYSKPVASGSVTMTFFN
jgi:hypothetical protein